MWGHRQRVLLDVPAMHAVWWKWADRMTDWLWIPILSVCNMAVGFGLAVWFHDRTWGPHEENSDQALELLRQAPTHEVHEGVTDCGLTEPDCAESGACKGHGGAVKMYAMVELPEEIE